MSGIREQITCLRAVADEIGDALNSDQTIRDHPECDREAMCDICHPEDTVDSRQK